VGRLPLPGGLACTLLQWGPLGSHQGVCDTHTPGQWPLGSWAGEEPRHIFLDTFTRLPHLRSYCVAQSPGPGPEGCPKHARDSTTVWPDGQRVRCPSGLPASGRVPRLLRLWRPVVCPPLSDTSLVGGRPPWPMSGGVRSARLASRRGVHPGHQQTLVCGGKMGGMKQ